MWCVFPYPRRSPAVLWDAPVGAGAERRCPGGAAGGAARPRQPLCKWQRRGAVPAASGMGVQRGHSCQTQPVPLPSPGCCSRKFRVNYRVQKSIVEGDRSGAGSEQDQPLPAQASSYPFHFELL